MALFLFASVSVNAAEEGDQTPFRSAQLIYNKIEGYPSCHAATIVELPDGNLMAAWYAGAYEKAKDVAIFASIRTKGNKDWNEPYILYDAPDLSEGNPVLFTDKKGRVWFFFVTMFGDMWTDCKVFYMYSDDGAKTWSEKVTLKEEKGWMTRNKPIELADGTIVLPMYNEVAWSPAFFLTKDRGEHWALKAEDLRVPGGAIQPSIVVRKDGSLMAFLRTGEPGGNIWTVTSEDDGKTWGNPARTKLPNPNAGIDAVNLASGGIALAFNDSPYDRTPLSVGLSYDDGETWPRRVKIEKRFGEYSYPAIIQSSDGIIHVVYTYKRQQIKHVEFNETWLKGK